MPIQALMVYVIFTGLLVAIRVAARSQNRILPTSRYYIAAVSFVVLCLGVSIPRSFRNMYYYSYLSYTDRYHETILHGRVVGHVDVSEFLQKENPPEGEIGVIGIGPGIVHYLTGLTMRPMGQPDAYDRPPNISEALSEFGRADDLSLLLVTSSQWEVSDETIRDIFQRLESTPMLERIYPQQEAEGQWRVYRRRALASQPATLPTGPAPGQ
jgi:hypothetical protein